MTNSEYHRIDAISSSRLKEIAKGLANYKVYLNQEKERKKHFDFGNALHTLILQPDEFQRNLKQPPDIPKTSNANKEIWKEFEASLTEDNFVIKPEELITLNEMKEALLKAYPYYGNLNPDIQDIEKPYFFEYMGFDCKLKADIIDYNLMIIDDLKTIDCNGKFSDTDYFQYQLQWRIKDLAYHRQAAFYKLGLSAMIDGEFKNTLTFIETAPPYKIFKITLTNEMLQIGKNDIDRILKNYRSELERESKGETTSVYEFDI